MVNPCPGLEVEFALEKPTDFELAWYSTRLLTLCHQIWGCLISHTRLNKSYSNRAI
jgi:hypothetical protein